MFDPFTDKSTYTAIRKHSAAHDIYNRLHSIARDTEFVDRVSSSYQGMVVVRESLEGGGIHADGSGSESKVWCLVL